MKLSNDIHLARPWHVHTLAHDFELLDSWSFELGERPNDIDDFLACFWGVAAEEAKSVLARMRLSIGRALGWDDHDFTLPIPGCEELSVDTRLTDALRAANRDRGDASPLPVPNVNTVYVLDDEALFEISNDTIHALLHVGLTAEGASLAVYVKHRGVASKLYMAAIAPFRHLLVYPPMVRAIEAAWQRAAEVEPARG
jgi:hypothetical protein